MVSFTKSNLSLQKNIFHVFNRKQPELLLSYSILFSLFNTVQNARLAHAGLLRKLGFLPAKSRIEILNRFQQFILLCRHNDTMPRLRAGGGESKGLISRVVTHSAAAGILWLSEGKGNHSGHVAGGPLSRFLTQLI